MAEAGSLADKVKQQADLVRVVGEYVRLKKAGQNFMGLCPFHSEKTPSFAVHPVRQFYHCFGCGASGDVFSFVMALERCEFPEAVRLVAEKCGIPLPKPRARSSEERQGSQQRAALVELHRQAQEFFARQLTASDEGRAARAYLEDRGLDDDTVARFGLGYAPSAGDALYRHLRGRFPDGLLESSGLFSRDASGRLFDRFRRRIIFPIANPSGKVVAFAGRALGDDLPKYLNSPETPIYTKGNLLYHLDRAREAIRQQDSVILVEGYMDVIAVARAGFTNVVASCGTSLADGQLKLLVRFTRRVVVNYDPDAAGQAATERSLALLLERDFDVRVLVLPQVEGSNADPDLFLRTQGVEAYRKLLVEAPAYLDYLIARARQMDLSTVEGKLRAVNLLMPYVQRVPNRLLRSEWAARIAAQLRVEEPVLREALRRAAAERRDKVAPDPQLMAQPAKPAERRLIQMLADPASSEIREKLAREIAAAGLHRGLEAEKVFAALLAASTSSGYLDTATVAEGLEEKDRRLLFAVLFEPASEPTWEEAESCLAVLRRRQMEAELVDVQKKIESNPSPADLRELLVRKQKLRRLLAQT